MESWVQSWWPRTNAFSKQIWRSNAPKCNPLRKLALWPANASNTDVSCTAPARRNASLQILFKRPTPAIVVETAKKTSRFAHFWRGAAWHTKWLLSVQECSKHAAFLCIFTLTCASRNDDVHFFDSSTFKTAPELKCFRPIFGSKSASRHTDMQFFISHLPRWLPTCRFS